MKFWAYVKQRGEGCDYTIACGETVWEIEADSWEDAVAEVRLLAVGNPNWEDEEDYEHGGHWTENGRRGLGWVRLVEVAREEKLPIREWYDVRIAERKEEDRQEKEQIERQRYEQLRQKYGD